MQIFYVLYFTLVICLLAVTVPESQGRRPTLYEVVMSLISYNHSTTSAASLQHRFAIITNSVSAENSISSTGGVDVCWSSPFGINGTCHPLDTPAAPTPTTVQNASATRTVSATIPSPIAFNLVLYKDMFAVQLETTKTLGNSKEFKSTQGGIPSGAESPHLLDLLTTATWTMAIVHLLAVHKSIPDSFLR